MSEHQKQIDTLSGEVQRLTRVNDDLLAACEAMLSALQSWPSAHEVIEASRMATAAIAKAEGATP